MGMGLGQNKNPDPEWNELQGLTLESLEENTLKPGICLGPRNGVQERSLFPGRALRHVLRTLHPVPGGHTHISTTSFSLVKEEAHEHAGYGHGEPSACLSWRGSWGRSRVAQPRGGTGTCPGGPRGVLGVSL